MGNPHPHCTATLRNTTIKHQTFHEISRGRLCTVMGVSGPVFYCPLKNPQRFKRTNCVDYVLVSAFYYTQCFSSSEGIMSGSLSKATRLDSKHASFPQQPDKNRTGNQIFCRSTRRSSPTVVEKLKTKMYRFMLPSANPLDMYIHCRLCFAI